MSAKWLRICCGQKHDGPICVDGGVMCCGCFEKFYHYTDMSLSNDGYMTDVCNQCADEEAKVRAHNA